MSKYVKKETACKVACAICNEFAPPGACPGECGWIVRLKESAAAADVAPVVHGRWQNTYCAYRCSECGRGSAIMTNFCPECGALMSRAQNSKENAHAPD